VNLKALKAGIDLGKLFKLYIYILILLIYILDEVSNSSQQTIQVAFSNKRARNTSNTPPPKFEIIRFKKLLLNFIISNNISFRAITTQSFKMLMLYLNK
jgi:hypothetical protein